MANYYTLFSEMIENLTPEEVAFFEIMLDEEKIPGGLKDKFDPDDCGWPPCSYQFEKQEDGSVGLWISSEENFNIDGVANLMQHFLKHFRPESWFSLTYAATCSKPRLGEFTGGGVFITAKKQKFFNAYDFVGKCRQQFEKRKKK